MELQQRINIMLKLGYFIRQNTRELQVEKEKASLLNPWFRPEFIDLSLKNIVNEFLDEDKLILWAKKYQTNNNPGNAKRIGLVMAGNIPLVGFHDFLSVFISGHNPVIKTSSKDEALIKFLVNKLYEWDESLSDIISFAEMLKGCDAYIATGSNNSSRYFEYYFGKYPNIIRRNRTSVAIIDGTETNEELNALADDIQLYFGLGCRNVTKLYVPVDYDFIPLLNALKKYGHYADFHKYKNNFDYQLTLLIMNNKKYLSNESIILAENTSLFSPISQLNYEYYQNKEDIISSLQHNNDVQCIIGRNFTIFGKAQQPSLFDYADGVDTMHFLEQL